LETRQDFLPGEYQLVAGMYDSTTEQRLVAAGGDSVELEKIQISK